MAEWTHSKWKYNYNKQNKKIHLQQTKQENTPTTNKTKQMHSVVTFQMKIITLIILF